MNRIVTPAAPLRLRYTRVDSATRATKRLEIREGESGWGIFKDSGTTPYSGALKVVESPPTLTALNADIEQLTSDQCLVLGRMHDGSTRAELTTKARDEPGALARTRDNFKFFSDDAVAVLLDIDQRDGTLPDAAAVRAHLTNLLPELAPFRMLVRPSSSAFVRSTDGLLDNGPCGWHAWILLKGEHVASFSDWLLTSLAARGDVRCEVSASGSILVRFSVDKAVLNDPCRIVYAAKPELGDGLDDLKPAAAFFGDGADVLAFAALPALANADRKAAAANIEAAKAAVRDQAVLARRLWLDARCGEVAARTGLPVDVEARCVTAALGSGYLPPDWSVVVFEQGAEFAVTVRDILRDPDRFHGAQCLDPIEPTYDGRRAVGKIFVDESPTIHTFAHGGATWRLLRHSSVVIHRPDALVDTATAMADALAERGFFSWRGRIARVDAGRVVVLGGDGLAQAIDTDVATVQLKRKPGRPGAGDDEPVPQVVPVPMQVVKRLEQSASLRNRLPLLVGVRSAPLLFADGRLVDSAGYDPASRLFFALDQRWSIPELRTDAAIVAAAHLLMSPASLYRFEDATDATALLAAMLTAVLRPALPLAPGFVIGAAQQGVGKTELGQVLLEFAGGGSVVDFGSAGDEVGKRVDAFFMGDEPAMLIDNVLDSRHLDRPEISSAITASSKSIRPFGRNDSLIDVDTRRLVVVSMNSPQAGADSARRFVNINLMAGGPRPALLEYAFRPSERARLIRDEAVVAALGLLKAGIDTDPGGALGSFDDWSRFVGAAVERLRAACKSMAADGSALLPGIGVLAPFREVIIAAVESDPVGDALNGFVDALEPFGTSGGLSAVDGVTVSGLANLLTDSDGRRRHYVADDSGRDALADALGGLGAAFGKSVWDLSGKLKREALGRVLAGCHGRQFARLGGQGWTCTVDRLHRAARLTMCPSGRE